MSNNKFFFGSICVTDLIEQLKLKHSAFSKAQNGKIYANVNVWLNEEKDKFGNIINTDDIFNYGYSTKNLDGSIIVPPGGILGLFCSTTPVAYHRCGSG